MAIASVKESERARDSKYKHQPLSRGREIRILMLQPHTAWDAPIKVDLKEVQLSKSRNQQNSYEALSYVWGTEYGDQDISCHDQTLLATKNCLIALRYLRRKSEIRSLWMDAICIDQEFDNEKIHQIP
jgi:hypothetical protein